MAEQQQEKEDYVRAMPATMASMLKEWQHQRAVRARLLQVLPARLLQLLDDLARNSLSELPNLFDECFGDYFGDYFRYYPPDDDEDERRYWSVRMRVLTAIANCRSLVKIQLAGGAEIGMKREEEALVVLRGLASNPVLRLLDVDFCKGFGRQAACVALGQLVASSRSLRELSLRGVMLQAAGLGALAEGFTKGNSVLEELHLSHNKVGGAEGAQHVALILATAPQLKRLHMRFISMDVAGAQVIANALPRSATLQCLEIGHGGFSSLSCGLGPVSTVLKLALTQAEADENGSVPAAGITQLGLWIEKDGEAGLADALAGMLRTNASVQRLWTTAYAVDYGLEALRHNSAIYDLSFIAMFCEEKVWMRLVPGLQQCKALRVLHLHYVNGAASFMKALLRSLKDNKALNELNITASDALNEDMFSDLMQSLQVNKTLRKISISGTSWEREGKGAIIDRALARKATQEAYLPLLLEGQEPVMPKAGRLFLCGAPLAGKTTLRTTMIRTWKQQTTLTSSPFHDVAFGLKTTLLTTMIRAWRPFQPSGTDTSLRTEGIEIEVLRNDDDMQVTIWDLAGQAQYRALQDHLFPTYNQACVFLFAFSPFDAHGRLYSSHHMLQDKFRTSLGFWLRFINSNCRSVGYTLPQVFVVVTHVDQLDTSDAGILPDLLQPVLNQLRNQFKQVIHVTTAPPLCMDARSAKTVKPLLEALLESFRVLFATRLFWVPEVCNRLSAVLAAWVSQHPAQPILTKQQFQVIFENLELRTDGERVGAILAYLHDVGDIISFQDLDIVVVNPHWISHTFLGRLIHLLTTSCRPSTSRSSSSDGFVAQSLLHSTLDDILKGTKADGINSQNLVSLMMTLHLCYKADVTRGVGFFVPFTLDDGYGNALLHAKRQLTWQTGDTVCNYNYVGRRLQCNDKTKTFLGPGFFPRFQVRLRQALLTGIHGMQHSQYSIQRNLINFYCDGVEVFLESSGDIGEDTGDIGDHIDILVRSCKTKDQTIQFLKDHIIEELRGFCASSEGSPGVELVEGIIRTKCVENLTLCMYRDNQSVLTQVLIDCFIAAQRSATTNIPSLLDLVEYRWSWPAIPEAHLPSGFEEAKELLSAGEVSDVFSKWQPRLSPAAISHPQLSPQEQYPTKSVEAGNRRGLALIISVEEHRRGAEVDRGALDVLLRTLKFDTEIVVNQAEEIKLSLRQIPEIPDLARDDCFLCCINAHGGIDEDGREYIHTGEASREKLYVYDDILKPITESRYLANKPKVFIINACRGTGSLGTSKKAEGSSNGEESQVISKRAGEVRPLHAVSDCLVVFSTSHGDQSFRDAEKGTHFIIALMEAIVGPGGSRKQNVLSIFTDVIRKVTEMHVQVQSEGGTGYEKFFQCPVIYSTLTRELCWS